MSTPANIITYNIESHLYESVNVNFDGDVSSLGPILLKHFKTQDDVDQLMNRGSIRAIHSNGKVEFYNDSNNFVNQRLMAHLDCEYNYLFWKKMWVYMPEHSTKATPLKTAVKV
jgi:hypothetical protein